uniref:Uncharacterized protein n=1 Tax=Strigamia maritima TaxID=126957 RepID=T1IX10_STRMM
MPSGFVSRLSGLSGIRQFNQRNTLFEHPKWKHPHTFFILMCLATVDPNDISEHAARLYIGGGLSFLVIEALLLFLIGIPLTFLETQIGQYFGQCNIQVFYHMCPVAIGVGIIQVYNLYLHLIRGAIILSWMLNYLLASISFQSVWGHCGQEWNKPNCFTKIQWEDCIGKGELYYNNSCNSITEFCHKFNMEEFNHSHCFNDEEVETPFKLFIRNHSNPGRDYFIYSLRNALGSGITDAYTILNYTVAWLIIFSCVHNGISKSGIVISHVLFVFSTFLCVAVLIAAAIFPGGFDGIIVGLQTKNSSVFQDSMFHTFDTSWQVAIPELIDRLRIGYGIIVFLASLNQYNTNFFKYAAASALYANTYNLATTFIVYSLSATSISVAMPGEHELMVTNLLEPLSTVRENPNLIGFHPRPQLWSFFLFLIYSAKTVANNYIVLECIVFTLSDIIPSVTSNTHTRRIRIVLVVVGWFLGLLFFISNPLQLIEDLYNVVNMDIELMTVLQVLIFSLVYGFASKVKNRHFKNLLDMTGWYNILFHILQFAYYGVIPVFIMIFGITRLRTFSSEGRFPTDKVWKVFIATVHVLKTPIIIFGFAGYKIWKAHKLKQQLKTQFIPTNLWLPQPVIPSEPYKSVYKPGTWKYRLDMILDGIGVEK